ncbi:KAP family P-loop NTPase fold protein [Nitrosomonas communis]|uniref:KAP family P-loop domain-containing protein n=1 Tax=Nitrosomonas communis TaxID=44574 RepID=A0A1H2Y3I8_9PROT|nr:P-loop NTPase fold protein [Nitrosomonas communis]SDW99378.1 KAP family P-loop domain-containing protein [Nitrosomonas communis]
MRLVTPQLVVGENDAFINDALDRKKYGETLLNLIVNSSDELVISLDGKWGEGKTTFIKMWQGLLSKADIPNIYIDAFANDYVDDAFVSIVSAIASYAESHVNNNHQQKIDELKEKAKKVGCQLLSWSTRLGIRSATLGIIKDSDIDALSEIKGDFSKSLSDVVGNFIEDRINSHAKNTALIKSFRETLSDLPSKLSKDNNKPLVVIIDELDRCKPTFAVEVIETTKHLFSVKHVVFVLVMNKAQIEESIRSVYGVIDAHTYLQKFINLETRLPKLTVEGNFSDLSKYVRKLIDVHELQTFDVHGNIHKCLESTATHFDLTLRQLEKVLTYITIFYSTSHENQFKLVPIIVFLSVVKVINPQLFEKLLIQKISYTELSKDLKLSEFDNNRENSDKFKWIVQWLKSCLLNDQELHELPVEDRQQILERSSTLWQQNAINKENIIPHYAQQLSMFLVT